MYECATQQHQKHWTETVSHHRKSFITYQNTCYKRWYSGMKHGACVHTELIDDVPFCAVNHHRLFYAMQYTIQPSRIMLDNTLYSTGMKVPECQDDFLKTELTET